MQRTFLASVALAAATLINVTPASAQTVTYSVLGRTSASHTVAPLIQAADGKLYGAAAEQNASAAVTFSVSLDGSISYGGYNLQAGAENALPAAGGAAHVGMVQGPDGNFYRASAQGGAFGHGSVDKVTPDGTVSSLYSFTGADDGSAPAGALLVGSDRNLYGTTALGGSANLGTVYRITPAGAFTSLHSFTDSEGDSNPDAGLVQASDGNFYGTTSGLTHDTAGAVYRIAMSPALAAPVQLAMSSPRAKVGATVTLTWKVLNAFSATAQSCEASVQGGAAGAGRWSGEQVGTYSARTGLLSGSAQVTPSAAGTYTYALSCGGQEAGFTTLAVSNAGGATPTVVMNATPNPATVGQTITISATVSGSGTAPTGTVAFIYATHTLVTLPITAGVASFSPSTAGLPAGSYPLTASYSGDSNYAATVSAPYTITLNKLTPTVSLSATPNPAGAGQTVTISASAAGSGVAPTGTMAFKYGSITLASVPLSGGTASISPSTNGLPLGLYDLVASYSGDANYAGASSAPYGITIDKAATSVALTASPSTVVMGSECTLSATVTRSGAAGAPTGSVKFKVGSITLATIAVNASGVATFSAATTGVPVGYYPVVATYEGDGNDNGATSNTVTVYVRTSGYY